MGGDRFRQVLLERGHALLPSVPRRHHRGLSLRDGDADSQRTRSVTEPEALSECGLDAGYAQLAAAVFNSDTANADRRTASDRHARRSDAHL